MAKTFVYKCENFSGTIFSQVITDRTIRTVEVATRALNPEDMGALERAEGGRTAGVAGVGLTGG